MYFCQDVDLLSWEPGIFLEADFGHQALFNAAAATLTGTALVLGSAVLGNVVAGMVAKITLADDSLTQLVEITAVADTTHCTVSALRGRSADDAIAPLVGGSVKVTVLTFRPQIAAVGDGLLAMLGVASDRDTDPDRVTAHMRGFRTAATFGTLAAVFRAVSTDTGTTAAMLAKCGFYATLAAAARRAIQGRVARDAEGTAERAISGGVAELVRQ